MSASTRLGRARGRALTVAIVAAALIALLLTAPLASAAAPSPISSGTTTLTVHSGLAQKMARAKVRLGVIKPSRFRGNSVIFPVTGGTLELRKGSGQVTHAGGLKVKSGRRTVALRNFTINTRTRSLSVKIGGRTLKLATLAGASVARLGFGDSIGAKELRLTGAGARALDEAIGPTATKGPVFRAGTVLGSTVTEVEPTTVDVAPTGPLTYAGDPTLLGKLKNVGVEVQTISPTSAGGTTFASWLSGGTISPLGNSGVLTSSGGIKLVQNLEKGPSTTITLGSFGVELAAETAAVEVIAESSAELEGRYPLNLGNLGRNSIADLQITGVTPSPATRTVAVEATATIQPVAAEVLEGLVKIYQGYYAQVAMRTLSEEVKAGKKPQMSEAEIKSAAAKAAEEKVAGDQIRSGEALGSFSFLATGE